MSVHPSSNLHEPKPTFKCAEWLEFYAEHLLLLTPRARLGAVTHSMEIGLELHTAHITVDQTGERVVDVRVAHPVMCECDLMPVGVVV